MTETEPTDRRKRVLARKSALWLERSSWDSHWREISEYQQPRAGRFVASQTNRGDKRHNKVIDNTAIFSARTLAAGLMSGMTSPARPWFALTLADTDLIEYGPVKTWLHDTAQILRAIFASSNTYRVLHGMYGELGLFGTAASLVLPNFENVIHHYPMTIGEYALGTDEEGRVNTLCREFRMTVGQLVERFGLENCSQTVRDLHTKGSYDTWVDVVHMIEPRRGRDVRSADAREMPFASIYLEPGRQDADTKFLRESGFKRFRGLCPRWSVTGNDIYGDSPGMECLGDVKQLQHQQLRKGQAIDLQVNPPLQVPTAYKNQAMNRLPGGVMYVDQAGAQGGVRSAFEVNLNLNHLMLDIQDVRERIRTAYYADLFLMMANDTRSGVTATEVAERHEEKLLALGPVLERLHNELLSPLIDIAFDEAMEAGILPPTPEELQGREIKVEFVSVLAQAQRAVAAQGVERLLTNVGSLAAVWPEARHKIDPLQVVDDLAQAYGVNPELVVPDDVVEAKMAAEAQQQAAAQAAAAAPVMADTAKTASEINPEGLGPVQDIMNGLMGYNTPGAQNY